MGRRLRPNSPGGIFHLTARTLRGERLFTPPARTAALDIVATVVPTAGVRLLAFAIMPNHLHLVVQQGDRPLAMLMHSLIRRFAHMLQREHGREGPVFWRPYAARACMNPDHARNAIVYTNLNPVRARICGDPLAYAWTSHHLFVRDVADPPPPTALARVADVTAIDAALRLFAARPDPDPRRLRSDYRESVECRLHADRVLAGSAPGGRPGPVRASPVWGDLYWSRTFSPFFHTGPRRPGHGRRPSPESHAPSLSDLARAILAAEGVGLTLDEIRGRCGGPVYVRLRHLMIERMHDAGYRNVEIARFLCLSASAISKVVTTVRRR